MTHARLRKYLNPHASRPLWPLGIRPADLADIEPRRAHSVLVAAFPGLVAAFEDWHGNLTTDAEYDPALCIAAVTETGDVVGFIQCWTSHFIKDLAVAPAYRGRGIGAALLTQAFAIFAVRGAPAVDLKVDADALAARRLYQRLGMVEVSD